MKFFSKRKPVSRVNKTAKKVLIVSGVMLALFMAAPISNNNVVNTFTGSIEAQAAESATFSEYWFQDTDGNWRVKDNNGNIVKNAWLCDDAIASNGQNIWYLLDQDGNMVSAGLVQDQTGNYYSLETSHNGYFGMLRYQSGGYDGVNLSLEGSHGGSFAAIKNQDGISALQSKYGVRIVYIDNSNCVYTSTFKSSSGGSSNGSSNSSSPNTNNNSSNSSNNSQRTDGVEGVDYVMSGGKRVYFDDVKPGDGKDMDVWDSSNIYDYHSGDGRGLPSLH
jgi:hypothetical protein